MSFATLVVLPLALITMSTRDLHPLQHFLNRNRVILIFAHDAKEPQLLAQEQYLGSEMKEMKERDLVQVLVVGETGTAAEKKLSFDEVKSLKKQYNLTGAKFMFILIGKDGHPAIQEKRVFKPEELFRIIDAMPMRQQEMKQRSR